MLLQHIGGSEKNSQFICSLTEILKLEKSVFLLGHVFRIRKVRKDTHHLQHVARVSKKSKAAADISRSIPFPREPCVDVDVGLGRLREPCRPQGFHILSPAIVSDAKGHASARQGHGLVGFCRANDKNLFARRMRGRFECPDGQRVFRFNNVKNVKKRMKNRKDGFEAVAIGIAFQNATEPARILRQQATESSNVPFESPLRDL
jgi:hypothetical protein